MDENNLRTYYSSSWTFHSRKHEWQLRNRRLASRSMLNGTRQSSLVRRICRSLSLSHSEVKGQRLVKWRSLQYRWTHHNLIKSDVTCVGCESFRLWIDEGFLDDTNELCFEEPLAPFGNVVCFGKDAFAVQCSIFSDISLNGIFAQNMGRERIWVSLPETLKHLLPVVMEHCGILVVLGHYSIVV